MIPSAGAQALKFDLPVADGPGDRKHDGGGDVAGESAHELARRQREKAERLLRSADKYEQGARGEETTGAILDTLRAEGWAVFHDVRWPGRPRANIDHVVVGPPGAFVIDSKNWTGAIEVRDQTFRLNGRRQDKTVAAAGDAALAVAGLVGPEACAATRSVLCFVRDEPLSGWCYDVMVCSTGNLRDMLLSRPAILTEDQTRTTAVELDLGFRAASRAPLSPAAPLGPPSRLRSFPTVRYTPPQRNRRPRRGRKKGTGASEMLRLGLFILLAVGIIHFLPELGKLGDAVGNQMATSLRTPTSSAYADCAALRADYSHGVGTKAAVRRAHRKGRAPAVAPKVYKANVDLDTDRDGLACEARIHHRH